MYALILALLLLLPCTAWSTTLSGYVRSANPSNACNVSGIPVDLTHLSSLTIVKHTESITYTQHLPLNNLRRGEFATVTGKQDKKTGVIRADSLTITQPVAQKQISGRAVVDRLPQLQPQGSAFTGTVYADGYLLHITPATKVTLPSGDSLSAPNWVTYSANMEKSGAYLASEITFTPDRPAHKDATYKKKTDYHFHPGTCPKGALDVIRLFRVCFAILPDSQIQAYATSIGDSLVPQWQRDLPDTNPAKIHFHFYVVQANRRLASILSTDAGTVIIPTNVLIRLQNNAQLAALLSADIAAAVNQVDFQTRVGRRSASGAILGADLAADAFVPFGGLLTSAAGNAAYRSKVYMPLIEQTHRIGLRYMANAGYDIYQAPIALTRISERHPNRNRDTNEPPLAQYFEAQLALFYPNYESTHTGTQSYAAFIGKVRAADPKLHRK